MKMNKILAALCGAILSVSLVANADDFKTGGATIARVQGPASYSVDGGHTWTPLVVGQILGAGASIQTRDNAIVDVVLARNVDMPQATTVPDRISLAPDANVRGLISYKPSVEQNMVRLSPNTILQIDKLTSSDTGADTVSDTELDLQKGHIFASVRKLSASSQYLVKIPNGIAGVRGTLFGLSADGTLEVVRNSVLLSLVGGDGKPITLLVTEGQIFNPGTGEAAPLPPGAFQNLMNEAKALDTLYQEKINFSYDRTYVFISPRTQTTTPAP
jgi:hypothetical protein